MIGRRLLHAIVMAGLALGIAGCVVEPGPPVAVAPGPVYAYPGYYAYPSYYAPGYYYGPPVYGSVWYGGRWR
jgi:hypothetical protein